MDQDQLDIIKNNPISNGLDRFHSFFNSICNNKNIPCSPEALIQFNQKDMRSLAVELIPAFWRLLITELLPSRTGHGTLQDSLLIAIRAAGSKDFDDSRFRPLLTATIAKKPDEEIWTHVYQTVTECTPPPRLIASSLEQTPWLHNMSSFVNSCEYRKYVDAVLKEELGLMYVGLLNFYETYFGGIAGLDTAAEAIFNSCTKGKELLFNKEGWCGWPQDANQDDVLNWFADISDKLASFAEKYNSARTCRKPLVQPNKSIQGSTAERKIDVGFIRSDDEVIGGGGYSWSQILIPGELKSNPLADAASATWLDIGRYSREVLFAQDTRRFAIGFTLCGSLMRVWLFDRIGGVASDQFDVNEDRRRFVYTILAFFWMDETQLGFDPTIITSGSKRYIEIDKDGRQERLIIDMLMRRAPCIAGRATTCWKAHSETDPKTPLVIKDSWQYTERDEEGELLREATNQNIVNMARYYHHYTVQVNGADDDIQNNVRKGLDIIVQNHYPQRSTTPRSAISTASSQGSHNITSNRKRRASQINASLPANKRTCSESLTRTDMPNRVHRRLIIRDYGKPIYKASSHAALLKALEGCIAGHESLHRAGILHRDISVNNLMINEDNSNPSRPSFLIDLDLAIKEERKGASGAKGKTGTRAFMAIGALRGEQHSFMHDLESFFWVLFWICIHDDGPNGKRLHKVSEQFDKWNYVNTQDLMLLKAGIISTEESFYEITADNFTKYYQSLAPLVNELRKVIFPDEISFAKGGKNLMSSVQESEDFGHVVT
ncbi:hypothetical protein F4774DRAFT_422336 [Daldinia eschscholtzii]|nr:hypothetical protein F4774DRAFT_422336 [Daldinia eschscholtzii]